MQILTTIKSYLSLLFRETVSLRKLSQPLGNGAPWSTVASRSLGFCSLAQGSWHHCPSPHRRQCPIQEFGVLPEGRGSGGHLEGPWQQTILFDTQHPTPVALPSPGRSSEGFSLSLHKCPGSKCWGVGSGGGRGGRCWAGRPAGASSSHLASSRFSLMPNKEASCHTCGC